jgi:integrase
MIVSDHDSDHAHDRPRSELPPAAQGYVAHETAAAFSRMGGVRVRALRERLRPHGRVRIEPIDMRRVCDRPDRFTLIGQRDAALMATLPSSALRVTELAGLLDEDVVARRGGWLLLVLGKSDEEVREAPLSQEAKDLIDTWLRARPVTSPYIFYELQGERPK